MNNRARLVIQVLLLAAIVAGGLLSMHRERRLADLCVSAVDQVGDSCVESMNALADRCREVLKGCGCF